MKAEQMQEMEACAKGSLAGELIFPQVVARLAAIGVERYHADYSRGEITYYLPNGKSHVVGLPHPAHTTGETFSAAAVEAAVRQSQRGEHPYVEFLHKTMDAGCVGYFVLISGRRVIYFGRNGDSHTEYFPSAT